MERLFSTQLTVNNQSTAYEVFFEHEQYCFQPEKADQNVPSFFFKRENDEWHNGAPVNADIKNQAIEALEKYLLAQH